MEKLKYLYIVQGNIKEYNQQKNNMEFSQKIKDRIMI